MTKDREYDERQLAAMDHLLIADENTVNLDDYGVDVDDVYDALWVSVWGNNL